MISIADHRPTYARTDLENLAFNYRSVRKFVGAESKTLVVVKADAYGHGAVECSRRLVTEGVDWLGVALLEEGIDLRCAGIEVPILILGSFWPWQADTVLKYRLTPVVFTLEQAIVLSEAAKQKGITADYHLKIDTGMGRIGVRMDAVRELALRLREFSNIHLEGVMTHFAAADDLEQASFTNEQIRRFDSALAVLRSLGFAPSLIDLANSPGAVAYPASRRNVVRIGGILYGLGGDVLPVGLPAPELRPVLSVMSAIAHIKSVPKGESLGYGRTFVTERESIIATVPIGYADGYPRSLSNRGQVIVNGSYSPVVGRVSMDWTIIDVTDVPAAVGDSVTIIGGQGPLSVRAEDLASVCGTISYEITCGISRRVRRVY
jgi:alanine racemase